MIKKGDVRFGQTVAYSTGIWMRFTVHQGHIFFSGLPQCLKKPERSKRNQCTDAKKLVSTEMYRKS